MVACVMAVVTYAQPKFDVHAGLSMANITNSEAGMRVGYNVGVGLDYPLTEAWHFQSGINFTSKGAKDTEAGVKTKMKPVYLDIPFLAAYKFDIDTSNKIVLNFGPYVGFGVGGKMTLEENGIEVSSKLFTKVGENDKPIMNRCALGLQYGVGLELADTYLVNLTGQYGFTNMIKDTFTGGEKNKNLAFLLTVGYRF